MSKPPTKAKPKAVNVPLGDIGQLPEIFQPRDFDADGYKAAASKARSEEHIQELVKVLRDGRLLDPLEVAPVEGLDFGDIILDTRYVVVDGHHRLAAYRDAAKGDKSKRIPCLILDGFSRSQLMVRAGELNNKQKLPMTDAQRMQNAWRVYIACYRDLKQLPVRKLAGLLNVEKTAVGRIKAAVEGLLARDPEMRRVLNVPGHSDVPAWRNIHQRHWDADGSEAEMEQRWLKARIKFEANLQQVLTGKYANSLPEAIRDAAIISALRMAQGIEVDVLPRGRNSVVLRSDATLPAPDY